MLFFGLVLWLTSTITNITPSEYLVETSECARNSVQVKLYLSKFTLGSDTFKSLIEENHVFVDKSLLLREIFSNHTFLTIFYLPPKFSKSINLDMIRTFVEIQLDSNYSIVAHEHTFAYNYFALGNIVYENGTVDFQLRKPPLISRYMDLINQHVAQHPAIYFDFGAMRGGDFGTSWGCVKDRVGREFRRYSFLRSQISTNESARFMQLFDYFNQTEWELNNDPAAIDLLSTVIFLAEIVTKGFQKKPILFVDEYDSLLDSFLNQHYVNEIEDRKVLEFFANFIDTIYSREDLWHRIILTGTHSMHRNIMDSLPVSKAIYHALDNNLSHFFGFTEVDVIRISKQITDVPDHQHRQIRDYHKGYQMGQLYPIYCPSAIMNSLLCELTGKLTNHWEKEIKYNWFLYHLWFVNEMRHLWLNLLSDRFEYVSCPFEKFTQDDFWTLRKTLDILLRAEFSPKYSVSLNSKQFTRVLMYQVDVGYLTWSNYEVQNHNSEFNLRIANLETRKAAFDNMRLVYEQYLDVNVNLVDNATAILHTYLFSRQRDQHFEVLIRSFDQLFSQTRGLFEGNTSSASNPAVNPIGNHIIEYIGLRLRYEHDHRLDRKIADGFVSCKLNVSSVVIFNYNQSVSNDDILNQIDNLTHPWIQLGPEFTNTSVTYLVIGVKNGTEISTRRYGAEPPIEITTEEPVRRTTMRDKSITIPESLDKLLEDAVNAEEQNDKASSPKGGKKNKKSKSGSIANAEVTKSLNESFKNKAKDMPADRVTKSMKIHAPSHLPDITKGVESVQQSPSLESISLRSISASQFNSNVTNSLNESLTIQTIVTSVISVTESMEICTRGQSTEPKQDLPEDNITTIHPAESNQTNTSSFGTTQQSPSTESTPQGSKFSPSITKPSIHSIKNISTTISTKSNPIDNASFKTTLQFLSTKSIPRGAKFTPLIDSLTNETTVRRKDNVTKPTKIHTSDYTKNHSENNTNTTGSTNSNSTKSTTVGPVEQTLSHWSPSNCKFHPTLTKSSTNQTPSQIVNNSSNSTEVHKLLQGAKSILGYSENNTFNTVAFAESSLNQMTRVKRSISNEQSPPNTFFPPPRLTRRPFVRRPRTTYKYTPKTTTISRIKFLKLFFKVHD